MTFRSRIESFSGYLSGSRHSGDAYRLVIEITNACNLKCTMCPRTAMNRKISHMESKLFEKIISENHVHIEFASLNGYGEPLLHPSLFDFIKLCRQYHVRTGISSNCTQLNETMARNLLDNPPDVLTLAIDGASPEAYEAVRLGASFEEVVGNVKRFLELRRNLNKHNTFVILQCIHMPETRNQIRGFYSLFEGLAFDAIRIRQLTYSGQNCKDLSYRNNPGSCFWLWNEPMILSDGTLVPCCQDVNGDLALGNLQSAPLKELWAEGKIGDLRKKHSNGDRNSLPICLSCNMYQPRIALSFGASLFNAFGLNTLVPKVETLIARLRYRR